MLVHSSVLIHWALCGAYVQSSFTKVFSFILSYRMRSVTLNTIDAGNSSIFYYIVGMMFRIEKEGWTTKAKSVRCLWAAYVCKISSSVKCIFIEQLTMFKRRHQWYSSILFPRVLHIVLWIDSIKYTYRVGNTCDCVKIWGILHQHIEQFKISFMLK